MLTLILRFLHHTKGDVLRLNGLESDANDYKTLRIISQDEPELQSIREKISKHIGQAEAQGMKYWVLLEDSNPVSVVTVGKEPVRLIAPIGTPLSLVRVIDTQASKETLRAVATQAIRLSEENGAEYSYIGFSARHEEAVPQFVEAGFQELGDTLRMECPLDAAYEPPDDLRFERVQRSDLNRFLHYLKEFMSGSPDVVLSMILDNIRDMPDEFLDLWYGREHLYLAYKGESVVGMLDLGVKNCRISNIGVAPEQRGMGYGRETMLFGLGVLKEEGCERAHLRVHVDNEVAIHLYEALGFSVTDRNKHLIWWR
jgi:ribosomal protein S18 acetylase RimI-like enzyme